MNNFLISSFVDVSVKSVRIRRESDTQFNNTFKASFEA